VKRRTGATWYTIAVRAFKQHVRHFPSAFGLMLSWQRFGWLELRGRDDVGFFRSPNIMKSPIVVFGIILTVALANRLSAGSIDIISASTKVTWQWTETWVEDDDPTQQFVFNDMGSLTHESIEAKPVSFTSFTGSLVGFGKVGPFELDLVAHSAHFDASFTPPANWHLDPEGNFTKYGFKSQSQVLFRPTTNTITINLLGHSGDPLSPYALWAMLLMDQTSGAALAADELSSNPVGYETLSYTTSFVVDPSHIYSLQLSGDVNVSFGDLGNGTNLKVWFTAPVVPDSGSTAILAVSALGLLIGCESLRSRRKQPRPR
jgi:hypothetical protein